MKIVILTGAGISAESGISTFRDANGLWNNHKIEDVASIGGFRRNPTLVHQFYNERRNQLTSVEPNAAHYALAELEKHHEVTLVTQNVDDLHERAGSKTIHMHGELTSHKCIACHDVSISMGDTSTESVCQSCFNVGTIRPDIVWFGEIPYHMETICEKLHDCELFVSIGTSGIVYPAAGFVDLLQNKGTDTLEINFEKTFSNFKVGIYGAATITVPKWVKSLI